MTETLDLEAIEARCNAATPGPWVVHRRQIMSAGPTQRTRIACRGIGPKSAFPHGQVIVPGVYEETLSMNDDDADFIAHAREDIPALLARVRELEAALEDATLAERDRCVGIVRTALGDSCLTWTRETILAQIASPVPCPACHAPLADQSDDCQGGGTDTANVGGETRHCRCLTPGQEHSLPEGEEYGAG